MLLFIRESIEALELNFQTYSGVFIFFWGFISFFTAINLLIIKKPWSERFASVVFWAIASCMVFFAALRPIGIARDDLAYLNIYNGICPTLVCDKWFQGTRDWGWFSLVGVLKSLFSDPRVMLWVGAAGLLVKLAVIYRLARHPLLALMLFTSVFYEVLDLTAWRVALASSVFMVGMWLLIEGRAVLGGLIMLACGLFHKQAFAASLVMSGFFFHCRWMLLFCLIAIPMTLLLIGWYPDLPLLAQKYGSNFVGGFTVQEGIDAYIQKKAENFYLNWRVAPIVYYPLLALAAWLAWDVRSLSFRTYSYASVSIISAAWILWGFASLPDVQIRLFDFMILPVVFLAGICRFDWWRFAGVITVSGIFVVKYNVLHPLLTGGFLS